MAEYRNEHGDKIVVRDSYPNPVALFNPRSDRYEVVYESGDGSRFGPRRDREESFPRPQDAFSFAVETLAGEDLTSEMIPDEYEGILE